MRIAQHSPRRSEVRGRRRGGSAGGRAHSWCLRTPASAQVPARDGSAFVDDVASGWCQRGRRVHLELADSAASFTSALPLSRAAVAPR